MSVLEREVKVRPAFDCMVNPCKWGSETCKPGSGGSHGRGFARMFFTVRDDRAEVSLEVNTGWSLPETPQSMRLREYDYPSGSAVDIHTTFPRYEGQEPYARGECEMWDVCYLDTGYLMADEPTALLIREGTESVWAWLENFHAETLAKAVAS